MKQYMISAVVSGIWVMLLTVVVISFVVRIVVPGDEVTAWVALPVWSLRGLTGYWQARRVYRLTLGDEGRRGGRCVGCGYDLRGSAGRCPGCGVDPGGW